MYTIVTYHNDIQFPDILILSLDIVVSIAGTGFYGIVERISRQQIEHVFNVNTIGPIRLTQAILPGMKQRRAGKIVTITSLAGKIGKLLNKLVRFQFVSVLLYM